jgi:hypothetical protein
MFDTFPDFSLAVYSIYRNDTLLDVRDFEYGEIRIDIDGLSPGVYNFTIHIQHKGHSASNTVIVYVYHDLIPSQIVYPLLLIAILGVVGCFIVLQRRK